MLKRITSGGQTGADQAGLDAAIKHNIPHGGTIPKGRMTEDGVLPRKYSITEITTKSYPKRTAKNVMDSHGTVIFSHENLTGGSLFTRKKAIEHGKPVIHLDLIMHNTEEAATALQQFTEDNNIEVLSVAGSWASKDGKIYEAVFDALNSVLFHSSQHRFI